MSSSCRGRGAGRQDSANPLVAREVGNDCFRRLDVLDAISSAALSGGMALWYRRPHVPRTMALTSPNLDWLSFRGSAVHQSRLHVPLFPGYFRYQRSQRHRFGSAIPAGLEPRHTEACRLVLPPTVRRLVLDLVYARGIFKDCPVRPLKSRKNRRRKWNVVRTEHDRH